jgi:hypothetical protein
MHWTKLSITVALFIVICCFPSNSQIPPSESITPGFDMSHGSSCILPGENNIYAYCTIQSPIHPTNGMTICVQRTSAASDGKSWVNLGELRVIPKTGTQLQPYFTGSNSSDFDYLWASFPGVFYDPRDKKIHLVYEAHDAHGNLSIGHAYSYTGQDFVKEGPILLKITNNSPLWEAVGPGTPQIYLKDNTWYLTYTSTDANYCVYSVGLATGSSLSLGALTRFSENPIFPAVPGTWNHNTAGHRNIIFRNGLYYMVIEGCGSLPYNTPSCPGDNFKSCPWGWSIASSNDLIHWSRHSSIDILTGNRCNQSCPDKLIDLCLIER